jgi:hypothetical protein
LSLTAESAVRTTATQPPWPALSAVVHVVRAPGAMLSRWRAMMAITTPGSTKEASVSLTGELADPRSPLTIWLRGQLPNRVPAAGRLAAALQGATTLRPPAASRGYPWATVGGAISQRVTFAFAAVPPHAALLGAARLCDTEQLVHLAAAAFPAVRRFAPDPRRAGYVALAGGRCWWRAGHDDPPELEAAIWAAPDPTVEPHLGFFRELAARLEHDTPPGRPRGGEAEQTLLADCYLLALYETMYRSGRTSAIADALVGARGPVGPAWLRGLVPGPVRDDLERLGRLLAQGGYDQLAALGRRRPGRRRHPRRREGHRAAAAAGAGVAGPAARVCAAGPGRLVRHPPRRGVPGAAGPAGRLAA